MKYLNTNYLSSFVSEKNQGRNTLNIPASFVSLFASVNSKGKKDSQTVDGLILLSILYQYRQQHVATVLSRQTSMLFFFKFFNRCVVSCRIVGFIPSGHRSPGFHQ
jgi:hypothetical protein